MVSTHHVRKCLLSCYADKELSDSIKEIAQNESLSRSLIMRLAMKNYPILQERSL